jgi:hypothetical protein
MTADTIARLKITLDAVEPVILRRVEVPFDIRLDRLHLAIQAAMGWTNSHLYEIRAGHTGWGIPDRDSGEGPLDARKAHLDDVIEDVGTKTLKYLYDFGDDWEHTIKIERLLDPEPSIVYPRLLEASGRCPPEDIGGPWGYAEFLEAIHDPKHERHAEFNEWIGGPFDPAQVDTNALSAELAALAKRWLRKPKAKRQHPD